MHILRAGSIRWQKVIKRGGVGRLAPP